MSYIIEKDGTIISKRTGLPLSKKKVNGKWSVKMWGSTRYVHRVVYEKFACVPGSNQYIDFIDNNTDNYHFDNLIARSRFDLSDNVGYFGNLPYITIHKNKHTYNFIFTYNGKRICSESSEKLDDCDSFYRRHVLTYLSENVIDKNSCAPMYGYEDEYLVYNNRGYNVFYNKNTRRWREVTSDNNYIRLYMKDGTRKNFHAPTIVWNSFNRNDIAKKADFRVVWGRFFDLIKIK